jgi:hypothetical protein
MGYLKIFINLIFFSKIKGNFILDFLVNIKNKDIVKELSILSVSYIINQDVFYIMCRN